MQGFSSEFEDVKSTLDKEMEEVKNERERILQEIEEKEKNMKREVMSFDYKQNTNYEIIKKHSNYLFVSCATYSIFLFIHI